MKKIISFFLIAVFLSCTAIAQTGSFNNLQINNNVRLHGRTIYNFNNDSTLLNADSMSLPTSWAVWNYFKNRNVEFSTNHPHPVQSITEMLALDSVVVGDIATVADSSKSYVLKTLPASTFANWLPLLNPVLGSTDYLPEGITNRYNVQSDWDAGSGLSAILHKPDVVKVGDTLDMLDPYAKKGDSTTLFVTPYQNSLKKDNSDSTNPITGYTPLYQNGLNQKVSANFFPPGAITKEIDNGKYNFFGCMGIMQNGTLYAAYREATNHVGSGGVIKFITSTDKGKTWSAATTIASGSLDYRNVGGGTISTGRIIILYTTYDTAAATFVNMYSISSDDNGATWGTPVLVGNAGMTTFSTYGKVISIGSGAIMLPWYSVIPYYGAWGVKSTDNGATWGTPFLIDSSNILHYSESNYTYLGNNTILGELREDNGTHMRQVLSTNNGVTWVDKGNALFDSSANGMMSWLSTFTAVNNKKVVECVYANRDSGKIRVVYGYADNLINNGVSGWDASTVSDIGYIPPGGGYPTVVHFSNHPEGIGWSLNDSLSTDNANAIGWYGNEKSGSNVSLEFFTLPLKANNFTGTSSQFMKGDGSFDNTVYAAANKYLPLAAGISSPLTGNVYFTAPASSGFNNILINGNNTLTGGLLIQPGGGSTTYGGGLKLYSHSNASKPGWVTAGISSGSGGKFSVNNAGNGTGTDVFTVDASGNAVANGSATANSFIKAGGTPSQFLKADGSTDANTYLTTVVASSTYITSVNAASTYLPLAAGASKPLTGHLYFDAAAGDKDILTNETNTGTHKLLFQAGGGSSSYGGGINLYANSHATHPGDVSVGLSNNAAASFRVNKYGNDAGADVFKVDFLGNVSLFNKAKYTSNPTMTAADSLALVNKKYADSLKSLVIDSLRNNAGILEARKNNVFVPQFTLPTGNANSNIGTGFRLAVPNTNNIKTLFPGTGGIRIDSTSNPNGLTINVDSATFYTAKGIKSDTSLNPGFVTLVLDSLYMDSLITAKSSRPYKVYTALLNQPADTSAPVATILENTLGGAVVWAWSSTGSYSATLTGAFPTGKVAFILGANQTGVTPPVYPYAFRYDDNTIYLKQIDGSGSAINGYLSDYTIEIRVYQ